MRYVHRRYVVPSYATPALTLAGGLVVGDGVLLQVLPPLAVAVGLCTAAVLLASVLPVPTAVGDAVIAWAVVDAFAENRSTTLSWHGRPDVLMLVLLPAACALLAATRRRRPAPRLARARVAVRGHGHP